MTRLPDFDRIAPVYDSLSSLVFGRAIFRSQIVFLEKIPAHSKILVLGGGTGKFLKPLFEINPACEVWYIDSSHAMMERAKKQVPHSSRITFIVGTQETLPPGMTFDCAITFFYLDLFRDKQLGDVIKTIKASLKKNGQWLVADFVNKNRWWTDVLLKLMYSFFRLTCSISADRLPEWKTQMSRAGFHTISQTACYNGFIESHIFGQSTE